MPRASPFFFFPLLFVRWGGGRREKTKKLARLSVERARDSFTRGSRHRFHFSASLSLSLCPSPSPSPFVRSFARSLVRSSDTETSFESLLSAKVPISKSESSAIHGNARTGRIVNTAPGMRESTDDPRHVASRRVASTRGLRANRLAWASARARSRATFEKGVTTPCVSTRAPPKPGRLFSSFHYLPHSLSLSLCFYLAASMFIITCHDDSILDRNSHVCFSHDFLTQFLFPHHVTIFFFSLEKNRVEETFAVCLPPRRKKRKTFSKMFVVEHRITCTYIYIYIFYIDNTTINKEKRITPRRRRRSRRGGREKKKKTLKKILSFTEHQRLIRAR